MIRKPQDRKILIVGDPGSIHTARFSYLLTEIGYRVEIFHSEFYYAQDENLKNTKIYVSIPCFQGQNRNEIIGASVFWNLIFEMIKSWPLMSNFLAARLKDQFNFEGRAQTLANIIRTDNPDIIISLKMQNEGYTVARAKEILGGKLRAPWVHFTWGTDLEFFGKDPVQKKTHLKKIREVLQNCDFFLADSQRDVEQAVKFGLKGQNLGFFLATGGYDLEELSSIKKSTRKKNIILVKGRQGGHIGKAFNILTALSDISTELRDYEIKIMMATPDVVAVSGFLQLQGKLNCEIIERVPYKKLLKLMAESRIAIAATDVDGTPSFLVESMSLGALPIHSDMASIREWITDGENGLLFSVDNIEKLKLCIRKALKDDSFVEEAAKLNWQITRKCLDRHKNRDHVKNLIENRILRQNREY
jgi:glycosyltransferase involved in cell wall biosynthesis